MSNFANAFKFAKIRTREIYAPYGILVSLEILGFDLAQYLKFIHVV